MVVPHRGTVDSVRSPFFRKDAVLITGNIPRTQAYSSRGKGKGWLELRPMWAARRVGKAGQRGVLGSPHYLDLPLALAVSSKS